MAPSIPFVNIISILLIHQTLQTNAITCSDPTGSSCDISCAAIDGCKDQTVTCRAGIPCTVDCRGTAACSGNTVIDGTAATAVTIMCDAVDACKSNNVEIYCGSGPCDISCSGVDACQDADIDPGSASSYSCSPLTNCPSEPPYSNPTPQPVQAIPNPTTADPTTSVPTTSEPSQNPSIEPTIEPTPNPEGAPQEVNAGTGDKVNALQGIANMMGWELDMLIAGLICMVFCCCCLFCWYGYRQRKKKQMEEHLSSPLLQNDQFEPKVEMDIFDVKDREAVAETDDDLRYPMNDDAQSDASAQRNFGYMKENKAKSATSDKTGTFVENVSETVSIGDDNDVILNGGPITIADSEEVHDENMVNTKRHIDYQHDVTNVNVCSHEQDHEFHAETMGFIDDRSNDDDESDDDDNVTDTIQ